MKVNIGRETKARNTNEPAKVRIKRRSLPCWDVIYRENHSYIPIGVNATGAVDDEIMSLPRADTETASRSS
jgi:hypothetical protein